MKNAAEMHPPLRAWISPRHPLFDQFLLVSHPALLVVSGCVKNAAETRAGGAADPAVSAC